MTPDELSANLPENAENDFPENEKAEQGENTEQSVTSENSVPEKELTPAEKPPFCSTAESIFALIFLFTGYLFIKLFIRNGCGIAAALFLIAVLVLSAVLAKLRRADGSRSSKLYFVLAVVFALGTGVSANGMIRFMSFCFAAVYYAMWAFALNNPEWKGFGANAFHGVCEAVMGVPKRNFTACPKAACGLFRRKSGAKNVGYAAAGLMLSLPITVVVCVLLMSADDGFENMLGRIFDSISLTELWFFLLGLPVSFLLFGVIYGAVSSKGKLRTDEALYEAKNEKMRFAPPALVCSFTAPLLIVYVLFFFSQLGYFISAFGGVIPEQFSASEYARKGFFELCAVAMINLAVIAAVNAFCRRDEKNTALKAVTVILSVFTLILIATAESKMFLYIDRFGLTSKRVYTSWFMFILAAVFILIIISRFKKFRAASVGAAVITAASLLLGFCNADGLIAKYDAKLIENGVMTAFPDDLSADAAPAIAKYMKSKNKTLADAADASRQKLMSEVSSKEWFDCTLSDIIALYEFLPFFYGDR